MNGSLLEAQYPGDPADSAHEPAGGGPRAFAQLQQSVPVLDRLPQFLSVPTVCQFAQRGSWENAWSFPSDRLPSRAELLAYLAQRTEVAFEAFFGRCFFGARVSGSALEVETFSVKCLRAVGARDSFFEAFRRELGCPVPGQPPAFAEIGCVNAWRSMGAIRISEPQLALPEFERLWPSVLESSLARKARHAKAIEFAFEQPFAHWFGVPVSAAGGSNQVSEPLLRQALGLVARREGFGKHDSKDHNSGCGSVWRQSP